VCAAVTTAGVGDTDDDAALGAVVVAVVVVNRVVDVPCCGSGSDLAYLIWRILRLVHIVI